MTSRHDRHLRKLAALAPLARLAALVLAAACTAGPPVGAGRAAPRSAAADLPSLDLDVQMTDRGAAPDTAAIRAHFAA